MLSTEVIDLQEKLSIHINIETYRTSQARHLPINLAH
jgi:hypothetical protein